MSDRFNGNINIGGQVTREQFKAICALVEPCVDMNDPLEKDGQTFFHDCVNEDFADLVQYCEEHKIALLLQWDSKYEYDAQCEYWIDGKYKQFLTDSSGRIVVLVSDLHEKRASMTINEFLTSLEIPEFPEFSIADGTHDPFVPDEFGVLPLPASSEFAQSLPKRTVKIYYSNGDVITKQLGGTNDEIIENHLGKPFGDTGLIALSVHIDDRGYHGLMVRSIETNTTGRIKSVRREVCKIDDDNSFEEIILTLYAGDEFAINDVWVYDMRGEWINVIGYKHETVRR